MVFCPPDCGGSSPMFASWRAGNHRLGRQAPSELFEFVREDVIGAQTPMGF